MHVYLCICVCLCVSMYVCVRMCAYKYVYVSLSVSRYLYAYMGRHVCVSMSNLQICVYAQNSLPLSHGVGLEEQCCGTQHLVRQFYAS